MEGRVRTRGPKGGVDLTFLHCSSLKLVLTLARKRASIRGDFKRGPVSIWQREVWGGKTGKCFSFASSKESKLCRMWQ